MKKFWLLIAVLVFVAVAPAVQAQEKLDYKKVNLDDLLTETQKGSSDPSAMVLVWWVPDEFWLVSSAQDDAISEKENKEFLAIISKYTVVAVADGTIGPLGGITYKSEAEIRKRIKIKDSKGSYYSPLTEKQVDADTKSLSVMLKALLAEEMGPMGENLHFYYFPVKAKDGSRLASASQPGKLLMKLGNEELRWKLPLQSLLVPKSCPKCGEILHGGYSYCPWDGTKLRTNERSSRQSHIAGLIRSITAKPATRLRSPTSSPSFPPLLNVTSHTSRCLRDVTWYRYLIMPATIDMPVSGKYSESESVWSVAGI